MLKKPSPCFGRSALASAIMTALAFTDAPPSDARVTRIVIDETVSPAFSGQSYGTAGQ
jgi:hypothetical protein